VDIQPVSGLTPNVAASGGESAPEPTASAGYTASAQRTAGRPGAIGSISLFA
jgi:hypothetical protein